MGMRLLHAESLRLVYLATQHESTSSPIVLSNPCDYTPFPEALFRKQNFQLKSFQTVKALLLIRLPEQRLVTALLGHRCQFGLFD